MLKTRRRVVHRVRRTRRKQGAGFMDALRSAHNWIKSNKIISGVSGLLSKVGVPYAGAINSASSALGYGRKRRVGRPRVRRVRRRPLTRRRRVGGSLRSMLSAAHGFIKKNQLVYKGLSHFGQTKLASAANALGYGRRRRPVRRAVRHCGGANYFSTEQIAVPRY